MMEQVRKIVADSKSAKDAFKAIYKRWPNMTQTQADVVDELVGEKYAG